MIDVVASGNDTFIAVGIRNNATDFILTRRQRQDLPVHVWLSAGGNDLPVLSVG